MNLLEAIAMLQLGVVLAGEKSVISPLRNEANILRVSRSAGDRCSEAGWVDVKSEA